MQPTLENSSFPVFEANQVLSNRHLNQLFNYTDEQVRLTRANLIGIGIACGLEVRPGGTSAAPEILVGRGCGVTSEGYLIVEPDDLTLVSYKNYTLPTKVDYPPLRGLPVWEMFEAGEPDATPFSNDPTFLNGKVVLLFLELKKDNLRNCSPTNCDDRGAEVVVTVRRLLVSQNDQQKVIRLLDGTVDPAGLTLDKYEEELMRSLNLPDIRLPRYSVPAGPLASSNSVLAGFFSALKTANLATRLGNALSACYHAFRPVVQEWYPSDPFVHFNDLNRYGFLNSAPANTQQVRFLQYYYDLFDDLIKAYDEFRWKGAGLMCACCPPSGLFPRHLALGLAHPELDTGAVIYRHYFRASSAISHCEDHSAELLQLFRRLVEMTLRFTNTPPLPTLKTASQTDPQIRITPSKLGDVPVSDKAIPYYYNQDGSPRLFELWNAEKTRRRKADQNLGYRAYEYAAADFVLDPLRYDLEPYNFLRVEGHLGKPMRTALTTLLHLRDQYRLPVDIIALRTGAFDESAEVDLSKENCRFEDLEALYDATREEWLGQLCNDLTYLYALDPVPAATFGKSDPQDAQNTNNNLKISNPVVLTPEVIGQPEAVTPPTEFKSKYDLINNYAAGYLVQSDKLGGLYEKGLVVKDPTGINDRCFELFSAIINLAAAIPSSLGAFNFKTFSDRLKTVLQGAYRVENLREDPNFTQKITDVPTFFLWEEIDDRLEHLKFGYRSESFKSMSDEYVRRVKEVKQKQFLTNFLLQHPGIQHKAGVPVGGTFLLVYHDDPEIIRPPRDQFDLAEEFEVGDFALPVSDEVLQQDQNYAARVNQPVTFTREVQEAFTSLQLDPVFALNPNFNLLVGALSGQILNVEANFDLRLNKDANAVIAQYVNSLADGTVIADFFLPYLCCSGCAGVQYVLAEAPVTFTFDVHCTNDNNEAEVSILPAGGAPPYSYKLEDGKGYRSLAGVKSVVLPVGPHTLTVRDSANKESTPQTFEVRSKIAIGKFVPVCSLDGKVYTVTFNVSGGAPPYNANLGQVSNSNVYTSGNIKSGDKVEIVITDTNGCAKKVQVQHTCKGKILPPDILVGPFKGGRAEVTITPKDGAPPFEIDLGDGKFSPLNNPLLLSPGDYTLTVRDADKTLSESRKVTVPFPPLVLSAAPVYECVNGQYVGAFAVSGGHPPYRVLNANAGGIDANGLFKSVPAAGGTLLTVEVADSDGTVLSVPLKYDCPAPCDKPCGGMSQKASYRLWVQPGPPGFEVYNPGEVELTFTDEKGATKTIAGLSVALPPDMLNKDFHGAIKALIEQMNAKIGQAIGVGRLTLSYGFRDGDPFARLWIESFLCEKFNLKFTLAYAQGGPPKRYEVRYLKAGDVNYVSFTNLLSDVPPLQVPAFDRINRDQCKDTQPVPLCKEKLPQIAFEASPSGEQLILTAKTIGTEKEPITDWIWSVDNSTEIFYTGQQVIAKVPGLSKTGTVVRLTGLSKQGCFVTTMQKITPPAIRPK